MMGNIGMGELIIILLIVLLFVGARRLPELGRSLGEAVREFKKGMQGSGDSQGSGGDKPQGTSDK